MKHEDIDMLVSSKGVYPYSYFNNFNKLASTEIPKKEDFISEINTSIKDKDYEHFVKTWNLLKDHSQKENFTFGDYTEFYNCLDVVQLTDVINWYANAFYDAFGIDALHYITLPGASWDAML